MRTRSCHASLALVLPLPISHPWRHCDIRLSLKSRVHNVVVRSILLYRNETWPFREGVSRLTVFDHRCLGSLAWVWWQEHISNGVRGRALGSDCISLKGNVALRLYVSTSCECPLNVCFIALHLRMLKRTKNEGVVGNRRPEKDSLLFGYGSLLPSLGLEQGRYRKPLVRDPDGNGPKTESMVTMHFRMLQSISSVPSQQKQETED